MSVNNSTGVEQSAPFLAEQAILNGTIARDAFQLVYKSHMTFKNYYPLDYHRLRQLAKAVKAINRGCTIGVAAKIAGYSGSYFGRLYPQLADKCRESRAYRKRARIAAICEHLAADPDASIAQIARRIGEGVNMVSEAHKMYYGYGG